MTKTSHPTYDNKGRFECIVVIIIVLSLLFSVVVVVVVFRGPRRGHG